MPGDPNGPVNVQDIVDLLGQAGLAVAEKLILPGHDASYKHVPASLDPRLVTALTTQYPKGMYSHQSMAIQAALDGADICLATPTASGKSLVFMSIATHTALTDRFAKVLAIYPAKALIQDQLAKWQLFLTPFGIRVGFIDGSVAMAARVPILNSCRVVAMTPDVAHAWLLSHVGDKDVAHFLRHLSVLILDEAHVYDGAFGTNMAYFLRRLAAASPPYRMICSTATIGEPADFMKQLTGRDIRILGHDVDGSAVAEKTLLLTQLSSRNNFDQVVQLLASLARYGKARFLAFGDSRKAVERIVAAVLRQDKDDNASGDDVLDDEDDASDADERRELTPVARLEHVLPYRAGYEAADRQAIQDALTGGTLAGVVSTSALELGLDIGDLDVVVLLNTPPGAKAFLQRIGRAGRRRSAVCILLDDQRAMSPLVEYAARKPEPSWLYLENRYIQYANALCAAAELQACGQRSTAGIDFGGLPETFRRLIENELNPTEAIPPDLYALKQKAQNAPHYEFPIRSAAEPNFEVRGPFETKLGTLSLAQALREAYPGAVYYYMARPYRVLALEFKKGIIRAKRTKYFTTKPVVDNIAFPNFKTGVLTAWRSPAGFLCEAELQVSERVKGFTEQRGPKKVTQEYGPASTYSQKPLTRFFQTTGVCWAFPGNVERTEAVAAKVLEAFSITCGVHERDLGIAFFRSNEGPFAPTPVSGTVVFDATNGSLRLTERLGLEFNTVLSGALAQADDDRTRSDLLKLQGAVAVLQLQLAPSTTETASAEDGWVHLIARGEPAMYMHADGPLEVRVKDFRYTPSGIMYELDSLQHMAVQPNRETPRADAIKAAPVKWMVLAAHLQPIHGRTRTIRFNLVTGDERPASGDEVIVATSERARLSVEKQLGPNPKVLKAHEIIWDVIRSRDDHAFYLSDVDATVSAAACSDEDVLSILAILSQPSRPLLRVEFRRGPGDGGEVQLSEVTKRLGDWWKRKTVSEEQWRMWASQTVVKWIVTDRDQPL